MKVKMKTLEKLLALGKKTLNSGKKTMVYAAFSLASLLPMKLDAQQVNQDINQPQKQEQIVDKSYGLGDVNKDGVADERDYFDISPEQMQVYFSSRGTGLSRVLQDSSYYEAMLNPFFQPDVNGNLLWYGSGDVDSSGVIDWDDYDAMQQGAQNEMADVDGDGTPSTTQDQQTLADYLNENISYMGGYWDYLQTIPERDDWTYKIWEIDQLDTNTWIYPTYISGDYATDGYIRQFALHDTTDPNIPDKYDLSMNGRFNKPCYWVVIYQPSSGWGHGMNAILTGDNPLNFWDWSFIEPQNDSIYVQPGEWNIPYETLVGIRGIEGFYENGGKILYPIVSFGIDSTGQDSLYSYNEELTLERPPVAIAQENPEIPSEYALNQNYPNPFNPRTTIEYTLPRREHVSLDIYDIRGTKLETLVDDMQDQGRHKVQFDASRYSSGIYFYSLRGEDYSETKKMVLVK